MYGNIGEINQGLRMSEHQSWSENVGGSSRSLKISKRPVRVRGCETKINQNLKISVGPVRI